MNAPGALWNRSHPAFWGMVWRCLLLTVLPTLAPEKLMLNFVERHSFYDPSYVRPRKVRWGDWFRPRRGRSDWHQVARKLDYTPQLDEIQVPTLIACGRVDPQYPPACSEQLAAGIQDARLVFFEHSGHYPFIEEEDAFWGTVEQFFHST
jgi:proline iminopeptidase